MESPNQARNARRQKRSEYNKQWYIKNKEAYKLKRKSSTARYRKKNSKQINRKIAEWRLKVKLEVLDNYGGRKCCMCDERRIGTLQVDHINGGGSKHRKSINCFGGGKFLQWLRRNGFPPGFRILCANCNFKQRLAKMYASGLKRRPSRLATKTAIMNRLGGKCICCGKTDIDILTIHHVYRNGASHRRELHTDSETFYRRIMKSNNYDGLECRCQSCNWNAEWEYRKATAESWET